MSRRWIWVTLVLSGVFYQTIKAALDFAVDWEDVFDTAYWSGAALSMHWWVNR